MIIKLPILPFDINIHRVYPNKKNPQKEKPWAKIKNRDYDKVFCIGPRKTGTTSMQKLLMIFGFKLGDQATAEVLSRDWLIHRNAERIINYCFTADAYQDAPFNYRDLYKELDRAFPNSKFILTTRTSANVWYQSLLRYHTKKFSSDHKRPPNEQDLKDSTYRYKGFMYEGYKYVYGRDGISLYDEVAYKDRYNVTNLEKREYFKNRPNDFIEINLSLKDDFKRLCEFLNVETNLDNFPWENKT